MPKYVLTGVGGRLGRSAAEYAVEIAQPHEELVLTTSNLRRLPSDQINEWKSKGAKVLEASYDEIDSLKTAFTGADAVGFISTWLFGDGRRRQAQNVITAAKECGVKRICYTSFCGAELQVSENEMPFLSRDHRFVEGLVFSSGLQWNIQRNYLYSDNVATLFAQSWKFCGDKWLSNSHGRAGAYVAREDCGRVHAALVFGKDEPNTVHTVTGPELVTDEEIFKWVCDQTGYQAGFVDLPDHELREWWLGKGLPEDVAGDFSKTPMPLCVDDLLCCGEMLAKDLMGATTNTVEVLTGRKPLSFRQALPKYQQLFPRPEK